MSFIFLLFLFSSFFLFFLSLLVALSSFFVRISFDLFTCFLLYGEEHERTHQLTAHPTLHTESAALLP